MDLIFAVNQVLTLSSLSLNEINASNPAFPIGTLTTTTTNFIFRTKIQKLDSLPAYSWKAYRGGARQVHE